MRLHALAFALLLVASTSNASSTAHQADEHTADKTGPKKRLTDAQIKKILIDESIAAYDGNCPCPYSRARNGSRCGKRSAYNREGGAAPLCFPEDVTAEMVRSYRGEHVEE